SIRANHRRLPGGASYRCSPPTALPQPAARPLGSGGRRLRSLFAARPRLVLARSGSGTIGRADGRIARRCDFVQGCRKLGRGACTLIHSRWQRNDRACILGISGSAPWVSHFLGAVVSYPPMLRLRQNFPRPRVENIPAAVRCALGPLVLGAKIKPGQSVALTAGSRGIANIPIILKSVVHHLRDLGAPPF